MVNKYLVQLTLMDVEICWRKGQSSWLNVSQIANIAFTGGSLEEQFTVESGHETC